MLSILAVLTTTAMAQFTIEPAPTVTRADLSSPFTPVNLSNGDPGFPWKMYADDTTDGEWASVRFEPSGGVWISAIRTTLMDVDDVNFHCTRDNPVPIEVFVSRGTTPPRGGTPDYVTAIPADPTPDPGWAQEVEVLISPPLYVPNGENLFVNTQFLSQGGEGTCMLVSSMDYNDPIDTDWWSNAVSPPYSWSEFYDFPSSKNLIMSVHGFDVP